MNKPKTIFKYQSTNLNSILNFKKHALYMASPTLFNDPYDCSVKFKISELTKTQLNDIRKNHLKSEHSERFKNILKENSNEIYKSVLEKSAKNTLEISIDNFLKNYGVCCFAEINDNLLMWGHYADSFKGFCLEFRTEYEPFLKLHQVTYSKDFPVINTYDLYIGSNTTFVKDLYCTKSANWSYKREWRVLHKNKETLFKYEPKCLKAVYFGPKIEDALFEIICLILLGQNPEVELWKGDLSEEKFGINFKRVNYIPYVDAKRSGLI